MINRIGSLLYKINKMRYLCRIVSTPRWSIKHDNVREFVWTIFPTFCLLIIAIPSIKLLYSLDYQVGPTSTLLINDVNLTYKIIGNQWYWSYEYVGIDNNTKLFNNKIKYDSYMLTEEDVLKIPGGLRLLEVDLPLYIPILVPVRLLITASDVIHSWAVPSLGVKVDAVPGRLNQVCIYLKRTGEFYGQCSEICGVNHGFMPIKVIGVSFL